MRIDFSHWNSLWSALKASGDPLPWHERLEAAYRERSRVYHNVRHLEECLVEFDHARTLLTQPTAVEAALWFHDAVYDSRSTTNEEDSAELASDCLGDADVRFETIESVRQLILCTKTHAPGANSDAATLVDIDLAILGQPSMRFWEYERAIRAEYAWVPARPFAKKRAEILDGFLQRPSIFHTKSFQHRYEAIARANLRAAIDALKSPPA